jgi:hypothetical protein
VIPALAIDSPVQLSQVIPNTSPPTPGCPPPPPGSETFTVPNRGIATPEAAIPGLEQKAWIFGHSRWQNVPGLFGRLEDVNVGDTLYIDGADRHTGAAFAQLPFVVDALYLSDIESGGDLIFSARSEVSPPAPLVILQTSARESGANKSWLLNRDTVTAKARNAVVGNVDDPCKYLLLFVFARSSG